MGSPTGEAASEHGSSPTGSVTLLFSDIEGSTRLLDALGDAFGDLVADHRVILRGAVTAHGGSEIGTAGDGHYAVFTDAAEAVRAAVDVQRAIAAFAWPGDRDVRVRIGLHTGAVQSTRGELFGMGLHAAARVSGVTHGGQILLSEETYALTQAVLATEVGFADLGHHVLKDLGHPRRLYQVTHPAIASEFPPLASLSVIPNNLPSALSSFVGRTSEAADVARLIETERVVTVRGPGGIGKTRLALHVAADVSEDFDHGVWFVDLSELDRRDSVASVVARVLAVREEPGRPLRETVEDRLRWQALLLVIDNCEHVIEDCAEFVASLARNCRDVRVVATSREALGIPGESVFALSPLTASSDAASDGVRLFIDRATSISSDGVASGDLPVVAAICARLDGLPLAIELAAARTDVLTVRQIGERVSDPRFLSGGRGVPERQRSLDALIEWSHQLLRPSEQVVFRRVAVFAGGFTLDSAERVCGGEGIDVVDAISTLVRSSLLVAVREDGQMRYRMLQTIRSFALERLAESGEYDRTMSAFAELTSNLAAAALTKFDGREEAAWLDRLDRESANFSDALEWSIESGQLEQAAGIVCDLRRFWMDRGRFSLAVSWLERIDALMGDASPRRGDVLVVRGLFEGVLGDIDFGLRLLGDGRRLAESRADERLLERATAGLALLHDRRGDLDEAEALYGAALEIARALGDRLAEGSALGNLGNVAFQRHDLDRAEALNLQALDLVTQAGAERVVGNTWNTLALVAWVRRDLDTAFDRVERAIAILRRVGKAGLAVAMGNRAGIARERGDLEGALVALNEAILLAERSGDPDGLASNLASLGAVQADLGRDDDAFMSWTRSSDVARRGGLNTSLMTSLFNLAKHHIDREDLDGARMHAEELLGIARHAGVPSREANALHVLARIEFQLGDVAEATRLAMEARSIFEQLDDAIGAATAIAMLAVCVAASGDADGAYAMLDAAETALGQVEALDRLELADARVEIALRRQRADEVNDAVRRYRLLIASFSDLLRSKYLESLAEMHELCGDSGAAASLRDEVAVLRSGLSTN